MRERTAGDEHVLIIPGERDELIEAERSRVYTIKSPLISRTSRYRVLLRLEAIERILERERPDLIESGDPYQVAWKAVHSGAALRHSRSSAFTTRTFPKPTSARRRSSAAARSPSSSSIFPGATSAASTIASSARSSPRRRSASCSRNGACAMSRTPISAWIPPSFIRSRPPGEDVRGELGIPRERTLLLYVGRLAQEKNTHTLFAAFRAARARVSRRGFICSSSATASSAPNSQALDTGSPSARSPSSRTAPTPHRLAALYRAADLFVHPGVQETFGLVTLEAQACGTPVIGIRGSYMDRIIHSDQTLWARENSAAALAAAIEETSRAESQGLR